MSDHADLIREALGATQETEWPADPEYFVKALAALDALVAERDKARRERDKALLSVEGLGKRLTIAVAAEAEVARLREALTKCPPDCLANLEAAVAPRDENGLLWTEEEDTDE